MTISNTDQTVLVLRACHGERESRDGFKYPASGPVAAPDWADDGACGHGLHGWLWGQGDLATCDYWQAATSWLVIEVAAADVRELNGKVKFPRGNVIFCGDRHEAANLIAARVPLDTAVMFRQAQAGDGGTATVGDGGTATAGDGGTATAG